MAVWTVFEPEEALPGEADWSERVVFVREAFAWRALFFAPLVLLANRLWLAFVIYAVIVGALLATYVNFELGDGFIAVLVVPNLFVALELPMLRRLKLARLGFEEAGVVNADYAEAAERRFFEARLGGPGVPGSVLGLFPEAMRR
ncbi:DUF2628 domain-containing protein [Ancylobacter defluvii]|uniref:DUF2628 domain-containing protein n=1 Tax=Ancylobacter defluvii TaxID=1282440 RepID=A0A9W6JTF5_9HYPH|nr:DUF2628 domain-containing protein [Ancylobacter defluvii]MBS7587206.1 DUF2628 domain-containing protein [Ancylobacter defluvii]GLK83520.1 hypothetical protein GCM10017653_15890 [Ancylobacter defluvii]